MHLIVLILLSLTLISCLEDIRSLDKAIELTCTDDAMPNKCIFDKEGRVVTEIDIETKDYKAECVNVRQDAMHCGQCDFQCAAGARCEDGKCVMQ